MKNEKDRSALYKYLHKDLKEFNKYVLSLVCVGILVGAGLLSYFITTSFALFTDTIVGEKTIEAVVNPSPNKPVLDDAMIPVYYDESSSSWKKADVNNKDKNWYDYNNKKWANSVTVSSANRSKYLSASVGTEILMDDIFTMQVWIPRYKYKIWNYNANGSKTSSPQQIDIMWEDGTEKTGDVTCEDSISGTDGSPSETCKLKSTGATCTDDTCNNKTYTHPAFTFGDKEVKGFWAGKFEVSAMPKSNLNATSSSGDNNYVKKLAVTEKIDMKCLYFNGSYGDDSSGCGTEYILTKPNNASMVNATISSFVSSIMNMNTTNNIYGLSSSFDSHMIKNSEWGAVAYLSHSKYGTCTNGSCIEVGINNSGDLTNYITGKSYGGPGGKYSSDSYTYESDNGQKASTTLNIYGVYDMSGGANEYTLGNSVKVDGVTMNDGGYSYLEYPDKKYYDVYSYTSSDTLIASKLGDGIKEMYNDSNLWYGDEASFVKPSYPWTLRGGYGYNNTISDMLPSGAHYGGTKSGIFSVGYNGDNTFYYNSSRLIITP